MALIVERACPKVNLTLRVIGRRDDGYHELDSLVAFASEVFDVITLDLDAAPQVSISGPFAPSLAGQNLIAVTLDRIAERAPDLRLGAVHLEKNLPIAAGIGGGSADAAAVIRAVKAANGCHATAVDWAGIAASLGADVPVCLASQAQRMTGIGEQLSAVVSLPELVCVLVNPMVPVPVDKTAQVFARLAAQPLVGSPVMPAWPKVQDRASLLASMNAVGNDLLAPARLIVPAIETVLAALDTQAGCELALLSGGGPTCYGVFIDHDAALTAAAQLSAEHPTWWVACSRLL